MQDLVKRRATYADLEAVPPHLVAELLNGELVTHPRPTGRHGRVHSRLLVALGAEFEDGAERASGRGGWVCITEPELHLGDDVAVPELAGWRIERMPPPPADDPLDPARITLVPDWVCEVLSKSTEEYDRGEKSDIYARNGIRHLWLVDPRIEQLEAYELAGGGWRLIGLHRGGAVVRVPPFEAVQLDLGRVWPTRRRASP